MQRGWVVRNQDIDPTLKYAVVTDEPIEGQFKASNPIDEWYSMNTQIVNPASQAHVVKLAEQCLRKNSHLAQRAIVCEFLNGVLILRGCLPNYYLKQIAQQAVFHLEGVERIDNQIQVVTPPFQSRRDES